MMYQRKDKGERSGYGHQEGILDLFSMLESSESETVESVKNVIHENLSATKDSRLLNSLVEYYLSVQSDRSLDILLRVKDPHDKHLFERINELMKNETSRYQSLQLLCNLVYKQPSWLHKIANHRIMNTLLHLLKNDINAPNLMSALFIIICLMPVIPSKFGPFLPDTFEIFSRLVAWNVRKPSAIAEPYVLHLQIGVYSLFHRLYGMFPCNFLAYLRSYYGGRDYSEENFRVFTLFIKPMLERVRLHPLLVTASKETELSTNRWKKMAYHDIIADCATISLDAIEGALEGLSGRNYTVNSVARGHSSTFNQDSMQFISFSSQSSTVSVNLESGSLVNEAYNNSQGTMWSPSHACDFSTPPPLSSNVASPLPGKGEWGVKNLNNQLPLNENVPLDLAVEAKPEVLKTEQEKNYSAHDTSLLKTFSKDSKSTDSDAGFSVEDSDKIESSSQQKESVQITKTSNVEINSLDKLCTNLDKSVLQAVEAREEDIDKEVSELTSSQNTLQDSSAVEARYDTPFCSTTQNLTDEPDNLHSSANSNEERTGSVMKHNDDDADEMYNSMQEADVEAFVPAFNRYRYFSHCGPPPDIPLECVKRPKVVRSVSCPAKLCPIVPCSPAVDVSDGSEKILKPEIVTTCSSNVITTTSAFVPITSNSVIISNTRNITYEQLIPMAMEPLPDIRPSASAGSESSYSYRNTMFSSLSPTELLDQYIKLGTVTYLNQLNILPITSTRNTDWTHFGGKPPADEITILQNQILLLHNQLLFERHRKDVHSERNRRILGRAKKSRMQEELIIALKEQINLLEKDNQDLKNELAIQTRCYQQLGIEKKQFEIGLNSHILKISQDNKQLLFSNEELKNLLVSQKRENDEMREECKRCESEVLNLKFELELCHRNMEQCRQLEKDAVFMSKQLILLQELNNHYQEKIDAMQAPNLPDIGAELFKESASIEIKDLKQKLENKNFLLDASKAKITEMELTISHLKSKQKEQAQLFEDMKSFHENEMAMSSERLANLKKVSVQKDSHILELYKEIETLSEKINNLNKQENGTLNSFENTTVSSACQLLKAEKNEISQSYNEATNILETEDVQP